MEVNVGFLVFMFSMCLFGSISNFLILLVYRKKYLKTGSLYLLFVLALVDFMVSVLVVPTTAITYLPLFIRSDFLCQTSYFFRYSTASTSVCLLALIAVERYQAISSRNFIKDQNIQLAFVKNSRIATFVIALIAVAYSFGCFFMFEFRDDTLMCGSNSSQFIFVYNIVGIVCLIIILLCLVILYIRTYIIVKKSRNKVFVSKLTQLQSFQNNLQTRFHPDRLKNEDPIIPERHPYFTNDFNNNTDIKNDFKPEESQIDKAEKNDDLVVSTVERLSAAIRVNDIYLAKSDNKLRSQKVTTYNSKNIVSTSLMNNISATKFAITPVECSESSIPHMKFTASKNTQPLSIENLKDFNDDDENNKPSFYLPDEISKSNLESTSNYLYRKVHFLNQEITEMPSESIANNGNAKNDQSNLNMTKLSDYYFKLNFSHLDTNGAHKDLPLKAKPISKERIRKRSRAYSSHFYVTNLWLGKDWSVARMFVLVTVVFVITWIPWCLSRFGWMQPGDIIINIYFLNSSINPIIYSFLSKSFRRDAITMIYSTLRIRKRFQK